MVAIVDITNLAVVVVETGSSQLFQKAWEDLQETIGGQLEDFAIRRRNVYQSY